MLAVNGNSITVGECNWAGQNIISWGRVMYKSDITNVQHIYVAPYELGTTPSVLQPASTVKAVVNSSSYGVDITWNKDESTSGYLIEIYNATDVENGDFSTPVKTVNIRKNSTTSEKITSLSEGNYYAYVKGKRGNEASLNRGAGAKFYINPITSISLDKTSLGTIVGTTTKLTATINPSNTTDDKTITWTSNNENIVKVDKDGVVKAINAGTATVTATAGTKTATCTVNVKDLQIIETILKGDVNGDGKITLADCTKILAHVKKTQLLNGDNLLAADINGDGKVTLADYTKVLAYVKKTTLLN